MQTVSPFPVEELPALWNWLHEFPTANFDDYAPQSFSEFVFYAEERLKSERSWAIMQDGQYCGIVSYKPITPRLGTLHGICFAKGFCSSEEKRAAVRSILAEIFNSGVEKVCAAYFADNRRIGRFLSDLGAVCEGYFSRHTMRQGQLLDMVQVAIFRT